ncbi:hypothetical protein M513_08933 [Trichuris suis]|uniref:Uncharacterized protein n=1 Tax=Trichuris suis TaxID=68888 RepID=A0A085LYZ2_9BILA|nr:hypothetical protein M513_08933 [Trichuris suis]
MPLASIVNRLCSVAWECMPSQSFGDEAHFCSV